jgi:hypothetical protein
MGADFGEGHTLKSNEASPQTDKACNRVAPLASS